MTNEADMTDEEWDALTEREKAELKEQRFNDYLDECSPEQRARVMWEQS